MALCDIERMKIPNMASVTLTASEFRERVGAALDRSLTRPIVITKHGRLRNVVLSYREYQRLSDRDRRVVLLQDWTADDAALLAGTRMASGLEGLDVELDVIAPQTD
jgi:prevent-host-death family protein